MCKIKKKKQAVEMVVMGEGNIVYFSLRYVSEEHPLFLQSPSVNPKFVQIFFYLNPIVAGMD